MNRSLALLVLAIASVASSRAAAPPADCADLAAGLQAPLAVLRKPAQAIAANTNIQAAGAALVVGEHYFVWLADERQVAFIVPPGRPARSTHANGGILYLDIRETGRYRLTLDTRHWVDVIDAGEKLLDGSTARMIESVSHADGGACSLLRKSVAFDLQAGITYRVHLSGRDDARVNFVVTREPTGSSEH